MDVANATSGWTGLDYSSRSFALVENGSTPYISIVYISRINTNLHFEYDKLIFISCFCSEL